MDEEDFFGGFQRRKLKSKLTYDKKRHESSEANCKSKVLISVKNKDIKFRFDLMIEYKI